MRGNGISRGMGIAVAALSLAMAGAFGQTAFAQTPANPAGDCWIDAKTGQAVPVVPAGGIHLEPASGTQHPFRINDVQVNPLNPNQASNSKTGQNFVRQPDGSWIDAATGQPVPTIPSGGIHLEPASSTQHPFRINDVQVNPLNPNQASNSTTGQNFVRIPCPPPSTASSTIGGGYVGGELAKNWGRVRSTESLATTDVITNRFTDSGDPLGVGIVGGYNFKPWNNNIVVGPFASFDYLNQTINHNFAGGQFLGTTTHWFINAGVKAGVVTAPGLYLYGLAGAAFLNHNLNVNFVTAARSNTTTPGFTLGVGGEYQPSSWQLAGHPVSLFAQYQHTWWDNANFNTPTSSPAFNYAFRREDDTIKLGVNFYFGAGPAAPVGSPMFVKALPAK